MLIDLGDTLLEDVVGFVQRVCGIAGRSVCGIVVGLTGNNVAIGGTTVCTGEGVQPCEVLHAGVIDVHQILEVGLLLGSILLALNEHCHHVGTVGVDTHLGKRSFLEDNLPGIVCLGKVLALDIRLEEAKVLANVGLLFLRGINHVDALTGVCVLVLSQGGHANGGQRQGDKCFLKFHCCHTLYVETID